MIVSRITSKSQTTVPRAVRAALGARNGDRLTWSLDGDRVILALDTRVDAGNDPFVAFTEWADPVDCKAFDDW